MNRVFVLLLCAASIVMGACGSDSTLPAASGKASVRAINAIKSSEEFSFLIEERVISSVAYASTTSPIRYDNLDYTFNVDVFYAGESAFRRVASQFIDLEADKDYTLLVSGSLASPTLTLWEGDERDFAAEDTVFAARFAHTAATLGDVDYYFADPAVAPVLGDQVATLSFGEISAAEDFAEGDYVLTITAAGDPGTILFVSETTAFAARGAFIITPFDAAANNTAPIISRALNTVGSSFTLPDARFAPTVEFINASIELGASDIYDDEMLTSLRVSDHAFRNVSAELEIASGDNTFYYTPTGDTAAVTLESTLPALANVRYRIVAGGASGNFSTSRFVPDRRPVETHAKLVPFQASVNVDFADIYAVAADASIDDSFPVRSALGSGEASATVPLAAGSYDLYVTRFGEKTPLVGPIRINVALGDIVDMIVFDTVDPEVLDILFLAGGPTP